MKQKPIELMHYSFGASAGNQCGACCNLREYQCNSRRVRKCTAYGGLHSSKADWAKRWPACGLYGKPAPYQVVSNTAKRTFARIGICKDESGPIEGQLRLEAMQDENSITVAKDKSLLIRVRDEHYNKPLEEQYECTGGWKVSDPKTRPFKFSNEMEDWEYHG